MIWKGRVLISDPVHHLPLGGGYRCYLDMCVICRTCKYIALRMQLTQYIFFNLEGVWSGFSRNFRGFYKEEGLNKSKNVHIVERGCQNYYFKNLTYLQWLIALKRPAGHFSEQRFWPIIQIWGPLYKNFGAILTLGIMDHQEYFLGIILSCIWVDLTQ